MLKTFFKKEAQDAQTAKYRPKVLIGVAGFHGMVPECQENFFAFAYRCGRDYPDYDFLLKIIIKREQFRARNTIVDLAIANGCDYLLMLDDDMVIPPDLFGRMVSHDKSVLGALYYQRGGAFHPVIMKQKNKKDGFRSVDFINHFDPMLKKRGLYKIDGVIGGGCMLFKVDVFRKIPQPYFWIDGIVGTDVHVCSQLIDAGVDVWVDTSIELGHLGEPTVYTSRNIPQYSQVLGELNEQLWNDLKQFYMMNDIELESEVTKAMVNETRSAQWLSEPRDTWEQVRKYYQSGGRWAVMNLSGYNLRFDQVREWTINTLTKILKPGDRVVDVGCGVGYVSLPLSQRSRLNVTALDIEKNPTLEFFRWRVEKHDQPISIFEFSSPVPDDLPEKQDAVLLISVFDHLWDPIGMLDWATRNTNPGAYLVCDSWQSLPKEDEPQHILKFNAHRVLREFKKRGWAEVPEKPFLFKKEE